MIRDFIDSVNTVRKMTPNCYSLNQINMASSLDSIYETGGQNECQHLIIVSLKNLERSTFISLHFEINNTYLAIKLFAR